VPEHLIIVDAGSGIRNLGKAMMQAGTPLHACLMLTHSHWDHLVGFPFFVPAYFSRYSFRVCGGPEAQESVREFLASQMQAPYFPVDFSQIKASFQFDCRCSVNSPHPELRIKPIRLSHPNGGYGFRFEHRGTSFVLLTDNELEVAHGGGNGRSEFIEACRNADLLFHDAQYTEEDYQKTRGWGHSTFFQAVDLALEAGVKTLGLVHHDPDRTDDDLDRQVEACRQRIAARGVDLHCVGVAEGDVFEIPGPGLPVTVTRS